MQFRKLAALMIVSGGLLGGCSLVDRWVYRPDINQGNYVTQEAIDKLQVGQTKEQVVFIMGTPMLKSVFGDDTWYYVFRQQPQHGAVSQRNFTIIFNSSGLVSDIKASELENSQSLAEMNKQGISDDIDTKDDENSSSPKASNNSKKPR